MTRPRGGYIGFNRVPAASAANSAASGVWTLREAEALKRAGTWPSAFVSPASLSGLQLWLDAADSSTLYDATSGGSLVAADGGVARWEDKSGNDRHATQGTAANRPARKTAIQGGKDVLRFDGTNDALSIPSSTATFKFLHSTDSTVFVVVKPGDVANPNTVYAILGTGGAQSSSPNFVLLYEDRSIVGGANDRSRVFIGGVSDTVDTSGSGAIITANTFSVLSVVTKPGDATAANRAQTRTNGGAAQGGNTFTQAPSTGNAVSDFSVGAGGGSIFLVGDIGEVVIYNSALSAANRESVENYLLAKWGIA